MKIRAFVQPEKISNIQKFVVKSIYLSFKKKLYIPFISRAVTFYIAIVTNLRFNDHGWENNYGTKEVKII